MKRRGVLTALAAVPLAGCAGNMQRGVDLLCGEGSEDPGCQKAQEAVDALQRGENLVGEKAGEVGKAALREVKELTGADDRKPSEAEKRARDGVQKYLESRTRVLAP